MGFFRGFRAKFKSRESKKSKTVNVVCVKYNVFSEFDQAPSELPSCSNTNPGRNDVIKEKRRPTKAEIKNVFPSNGVPKIPAAEAQIEPEKEAPTVSAVKPEPAKEELRRAPPPPSRTTSKSTIPAKEAPAKEVAPVPPVVHEKAETSSSANQKAYSVEEALSSSDEDDGNFAIHVNHHDEDDGNFQIHVVDNSNYPFGNVSDEESSDEERSYHEDPHTNIFSSQATRIFFEDGEDEPSTNRPRNIFVSNDDDADGTDSSASA